MSKRVYNILFHTHTIAGITISAALYVIFFAGSFAFFRDEMVAWERNEPVQQEQQLVQADFNQLLDSLNEQHALYSRDITLSRVFNERQVAISLSAPRDTLVEGRAAFFYIDTKTANTATYNENYSIGRFLYRLHFFTQLNFFGQSGYILSGFVAFFFLFAVITGVAVHWNKIISNFYLFRPKTKLKTLWTDAHTTLGILGLPFQFMFALTGAVLMIGTIVMVPPVAALLYDGNVQKLNKDFGLAPKEIPMAHEKIEATVDYNDLIKQTKGHWDNFKIETLEIKNYGDASMQIAIIGHYPYSEEFTGQGKLVFDAQTGAIIAENNPEDISYREGAHQVIDRLHFGDFGGLPLRVVFFILGLITCFVIISGVMIWTVAREKRHIEPKKRKFNAWLARIYLAVCLSMYPVTAFTFIMVKGFVHEYNALRVDHISHIFFYSWLVLSLFFILKKDNYFTNKVSLVLGGILGLFIPIVNGVVSGNWFWKTYNQGHLDIFFVDVFWIILSIVALWVATKINRQSEWGKSKKQTPAVESSKEIPLEEIGK